MKIQDLLNTMEGNAFDKTFTETIAAYYWEKNESPGSNPTDVDFKAAMEYLPQILSAEDMMKIAEVDALYNLNRDYAAKFGFKCGVLAGFRQYFTMDQEMDGGFSKLVCDDLHTMPRMQRHHESYERLKKAQEITAAITEPLPEDDQKQMVSLECGWTDRVYNASVHGFYCGYRAAFGIIEAIEPLGRMHTIGKILTMEFVLGYIHPYNDVERFREMAAEK